jgi:GNAT superfamily N-acetyltransferase
LNRARACLNVTAVGASNPDVRLLEPRDVGATARLLAAAFHDDPAYGFLFPRSEARPAGLRDFFARNLRTHLPYRCTCVVLAGAAIAGTVTFRPPDGFSISVLTMVRRGLLPFALAHGLPSVRRLFAVKKAYDGIEARLSAGGRHWLVHMMAVDPAAQGGGLGSFLLRRVLEATVDACAANGGPPAILTTHKERNVAFYERAGFEVAALEHVTLLGEPAYPVWCMRRAAHVPRDR